MLKKAFQSMMILSLLGLFACSEVSPQVQSVASVKLLPNSHNVVDAVVTDYEGIGMGLTISTDRENIKEVPANTIWPDRIEVEIVNDKGVRVWTHTFTAADGCEVIRGRNLAVWELLPSRDRRFLKDAYLRTLISLDPDTKYSLHVNVGKVPSVPYAIAYSMEIMQTKRSFWQKLFH
jgi:hypothetical protein